MKIEVFVVCVPGDYTRADVQVFERRKDAEEWLASFMLSGRHYASITAHTIRVLKQKEGAQQK